MRPIIMFIALGVTGCGTGVLEATSPQGSEDDPLRRERCGNGVCRSGETCATCATDCGPCAPSADLSVVDVAQPGGGLVIASALALDHSTVVLGTTQRGTVSYQNASGSAMTVARLVIAERPPGGTNAGGPFDDMLPQPGPITLLPGESVTVSASRAFTSGDPIGAWYAYAVYEDATGVWHDGPSVPFEVRAPASAGLSIAVVGNRLVDGNGQTVRLLGVNRPGGEYSCVHGVGFFDGPSDAASVQAMKSWHINTVRIPMNEDCWLGINGVQPAYAGSNYQDAIAGFVDLLHQAGMYAVLDLHWSAAGARLATGQDTMANLDHSVAFWKSVATRFKNDPAVLFDLYNEPHDISDACWRDGCASWAGMQTLIDAVRSTGATQPILTSVNGWGNGGISTFLSYLPSDPLRSLVASVHIYWSFSNCLTESCWETYLRPMAAAMPLVSGEMGENDCAHGWIDPYMSWLDSVGAGYLGWGWYTASCGGDPSLILDYAGTPTGFGVGMRNHLATLR